MIIFDTESDDLLMDATKFHIFCWTTDGETYKSTTNPDLFLEALDKETHAGCHNSFRHDFPLLKKLLGYEYKGLPIDTLFLSWYANPKRPKHGLEQIGLEHGYKKVEVGAEEWKNPDMALMEARVIEDVKINWAEWKAQEKVLKQLYQTPEELDRFLRYIAWKGECAAYQEANPIRLDMDLVRESIDTLEEMQSEKVAALREVMPKVPKYALRKRPKVTHKKDGEPTKKFQEWLGLLKEHKEPVTTKELKVVVSYDDPNPNSSDQVKAWLKSLGWEPCTFKFLRDKTTGDERQIEQVRKDGELTPSVLRLKEKASEVEVLEGLTVIQHRLGIFKGFAEDALQKGDKWYIQAKIGGLTNTLRFKHRKPLVNLPGVDKFYGKEIRSCLIADDNETFIGSDMSSLEDSTKRHYMAPLDPDYVEEMAVEGFDPHMKLLVIAGQITEDDYEFYTQNKDRYG